MKYISKGTQPQAFTDWKALANDDWQPSYDILGGEVKIAVKSSLIREQGYLCCYCEGRLTDEDSHIEHFRPQTDPATDPLDFSNMLCSCQNRLKKGEPRHCGNLKGDWFEENLLVSPLRPECETAFAYTGDGNIRPANPEDDAPKTTIQKLGLNISKLRALRSQAIDPFLDPGLSNEEFHVFVSGYLQTDGDGKSPSFYTMIEYLFAK
jgi:uncharacterized protein (TIGR02646 family)